MKKIGKAIVFAALAVSLIVGLTACGAQTPSMAGSGQSGESVSGITVSGTGSVRLVPDKATVSFGVSTQEPTAELAQSKNSEAVKKVIAILTEHGVEEKNIRTTNYSMYPQYDYSDYENQRIVGYNAHTMMSVQDQNVEDLGKLISACVAAGISNVDSINFLCSGYDEAYSQALSQAVAASREKAETLAAAAGKSLGEPVVIVENASSRSGLTVNGVAAYAKDESFGAGPSIQPGETEISASVTVTYQMS